MIRGSFIINKITIFYIYISNMLKKSITYRFFEMLGKYFERLSRNSLILSFFSNNWDTYLKTENSMFVNGTKQFLSNVSSNIENTNSKVLTAVKDSFIVNIANENMLLIFVYLLLFLIPLAPTMILAFIAMVCIVLYIFNVVMGRIKLNKPSLLTCFIAVFLICYIASTFMSYDVRKAMQTMLIFITFAFMTFIISEIINNKKRLNAVINLVLFSGMIVSFYGIYQYFTGVHMDAAWIDTKTFSDISIRVYSTFSNPNVLGEYLIVIASLAIGMLWKSDNVKLKLFYLAQVLIAIICLFMTNSRGSMVGLFIAIAIFIILAEKRLIIFGVVAMLALPFIMPQSIWSRIMSIASMSDSSSLYRISIYKASINMIRDFVITGIGVGSFNLVYPIYSFNAAYAYHSHNIFLQVFIEMGIIGFSVFVGIIILYIQKMYYGVRNSLNKNRYIGAVILGGFVGFLIQGFADYLWFDYRIILLFWMIVGLGIATVKINAERKVGLENGEN